MGQTGRSIKTRCKEHRRHIRLDQQDKSVVVEHIINTGHCIDFSNTIVLDRTSSYMDCLVKEAIGIILNNQNFNRDGGLMLSHAWHPVIIMLSNQETGLTQHALDTNQQLHWLGHQHEHGTRAGLYLVLTVSPGTSVP
jgi:hypothetical protein